MARPNQENGYRIVQSLRWTAEFAQRSVNLNHSCSLRHARGLDPAVCIRKFRPGNHPGRMWDSDSRTRSPLWYSFCVTLLALVTDSRVKTRL